MSMDQPLRVLPELKERDTLDMRYFFNEDGPFIWCKGHVDKTEFVAELKNYYGGDEAYLMKDPTPIQERHVIHTFGAMRVMVGEDGPCQGVRLYDERPKNGGFPLTYWDWEAFYTMDDQNMVAKP